MSNITLGEAAGVENVTLLSTQMPMHSHPVMASESGGVGDPKNAVLGNAARDNLNIYAESTDGTTMNAQMIGTAGGNQPFSNRNPYLGINYVICTEGIFPSRS